MSNVIPQDSLLQRLCFFFRSELCRVDTHYHNLIRILLFQLPQLRKYVHAVDSAERPEIQKDQLAFQVAHL
jgi:hypothetical protein